MSYPPSPINLKTGPRRTRPRTAYTKDGLVRVPPYNVPKNGLSPVEPKWTFNRDKASNFLTHVQAKEKKLPGPGTYEVKS